MTDNLTAALDNALGTPVPLPGPPPNPAGAPALRPGVQLQRVRLADLRPDPNNPRTDLTDVVDLAESIAQVGLLQPIIVRRDGDGLVVVCGHRRLAALQHLAWTSVDVIVRREMPADHVLAAMLAENNQRVSLDPIEEARALNRLKVIERLTDGLLAKRIGRTQSYVSGRLALLSLSVQEQEEVRAGQRPLTFSIAQGRVRSGKVRNRAKGAGWHLSLTHPLASRARARCVKLEHPRGSKLGSVACGRCWESVIRSHEKQLLHDHSAQRGECALCGQPNPGGVRVAPGAPVLEAGTTEPAAGGVA
ncbi:ParB/RepB/Spo0J family partition protein [Cellulomonas soli]|uniref:ParB/RepB/Spo0J family partition protein n=1 Tax=Cellulomonas soli TaxID=931535 RepID=UPI003F8396B3